MKTTHRYAVWCSAGDKDVYLGMARGGGFRNACYNKANKDKKFKSGFNINTMSYRGMRLKAGEEWLSL